eukprot:CAMPEP_0115841372 /NCGR_PEP_ID=MMETSP0287-20121206/7254_1 /TAXON_ID=412157 /ORGANISM="Chrysochromulina rotalis, Strain UIO044" /LENGTH=31 /DNA_ID= /DNA_START= /DNA_END= /DNA_ORIENTATION=
MSVRDLTLDLGSLHARPGQTHMLQARKLVIG